MHFVPSVVEKPENKEPAFWFIFCDRRLLVKAGAGDQALIPCVRGLEALDIKPTRRLYLGTLGRRPCYAVECALETSVPEGMSFQGLRRLLGHLEDDLFWIAGRARQLVDWDRSHQYCGQCGSQTTNKTDERAKVCPECGLMTFPRMSPAIIVAVVKDKKILLARASRFPYEMYSVLAGFVEPGESLEACVKREVREEVGIEVKNIRYFGNQPWPFPNSLMVAFTADYAAGEIRIDETEIVDAGWFSANNFPLIPSKISIARHLIDWFAEKNR
ncbi:MAG: NAD(+) diphosphatase [Desulfobacteraceae bacterium]